MTIKTFIEKAIEGGWNGRPAVNGIAIKQSTVEAHLSLAGEFYKAWFLDPLAWQAVGKVEGWSRGVYETTGDDSVLFRGYKGERTFYHGEEAILNMHRMVDFLVEGGSIEEYLKTL